MASASPVEILRSTRQLPVAERELVFTKRPVDVASSLSSAGAAWGKSTRKWVAAPSTCSSSVREFGDVMPHELRTLVAASFDVFMRTQKRSDEPRVFVVRRASREYREALATCILSIQDRRLKTQALDHVNTQEESDFLHLMNVSLTIWRLCELLLLRGGARGADRTLAYELAQWLQDCYCSKLVENAEMESRRLKQQEKPEDDAAFWRTVEEWVMMGSGVSAWSLLASHSNYKSLFSRDALSVTGTSTKAGFQAVQKLLLSMPGRNSMNVGMNYDVLTEWKKWNDACQYLLSTDGCIKANDGLRTLLEVMAGKEHALKSRATTWYELMMARLFLDEPKTFANRFQFVMVDCFRAYNSDATQMDRFESIVLAIMDHDIQSTLQEIVALGFSWMAAHLVDLLQKSNVVAADDLVPQAGCTVREHFLLEYAMEIGASSGMWQFAVRYYEFCPKFGVVAIRSALEREPLITDHKAERLLTYCNGKKLLAPTSRRIMIQRAHECKTKKLYASALQWMLRGNHLDDVDALCDDIVQECNDTNSLSPLHEAVQFVESCPELARPQKLAWLVRYREFRIVLNDCECLRTQLRGDGGMISTEMRVSLATKLRLVSMEAAKRLDWLLSSTEAPKALRSDILQQAEYLLEESPSVFEPQHLYSLMAYLRQLDRSFDRHEFYKLGSNEQLKARIEVSISRNLAEAMIQAATASASNVSIADTLCRQPNVAPLCQQPNLTADAPFTPMEE
uniref:Nuclear pore complex protein Nup85 n=1 Tax=Peronospora matthiolae TaxID=2874970 RepID=A0AAV1TMJ3_9STRA